MYNKLKYIKLFEQLDPYGEEEWDDESLIGYFYVYRHRNFIDREYAEEYLKKEKPKIYKSFKEADEALNKLYLDDCDDAIFCLYSNGKIKRERFK